MIFQAILVGVAVLAGALSYKAARDAQKQAKKAAEAMAGVLVNKESNIEAIPVIYGERRVGGTRVFVHTEGGDKNEFLYLALVLCEGEVESITDIEIDDYSITDARFQNVVVINKPGGGGTTLTSNLIEAETFTGADNQAASTILSETSKWGANHQLNGVAYIALKLKWDENVFSGIPEITALVKGRKVLDPRTGTTAWSNNPALCIRDYLTNNRYGKGLPSSVINDTLFNAAANDCESFSVTPYSGATSNIDLFQCNAVIDTDEEIFRNVERMLLGCRGFLPYSQGKYGLVIDQATSSVMTLTTNEIIGGINIQGESKKDKFNRVLVKFPNPQADWQPDQAVWPDAGSAEETQFLAEDGNTLLVDEVDIETITNYYAARDFARILCLRSRNALRCSLKATSEAMNLVVGDVVSVTHPTPAFSAKPFQVEEVTLNYDGTVDLNLIEYDSTLYAYDSASEETEYPDTTLPDPFTVTAPTSLVITETTIIAEDGTLLPSLKVSWTASNDAFVSRYEVQWKLTSETDYNSGFTSTTQFIIQGVVPGNDYDVRVRAYNEIGSNSPFLTDSASSVGDTTAPGIPTSLTAVGGLREISISWVPPTDPDYSHVEVYENDVDNFGTSTKIAIATGDHYTRTGLNYEVTRFYWIKAADYSGNVSAQTSSVNATTLLVGSDAFTAEVNNLFAEAGAYGIEPVSTLPPTGDFDGQIKYDTTANKLYRWDESAGIWTDDIFSITSASVDIDSFAAGIEPVGIVSSLPNPTGYDGAQVVFNTSDNKLYRYTGSAWVSSVPAADVVGTFDANNFPNNLRPVEIVSALPTTGNFEGRVVYLTTDKKLYRYNGTSFIATVSTGDLDGAIQSVQIANNAVTNAKLAVDSVQGDVIAAGAITAPKLPDGVISEVKLANAAVTNAKIATDAIQGAVIAAGAITAEKILNGAISTLKLANDAVTNAKLAVNAVQGDVIAADAITADKILNGAISTLKLADNAVSNAKIAVNAIQGDVIAAGAISGDKIADSAVSTVKLANAAVSNAKIAVNAIQGSVIAAGAITETKIADNAVSTNKILNNAISTAKIANDAINNAKIAVNAIQGDVIAAAAITNAKIADGAISTVKIANDAVSTAKIAANAIQGDVIAANAITTTKISDSAISTAKLQAGAITTAKLAAGAVTADKILANTITASQLAAGTITAAQIAAGTITAAQIATGTITAAKIASNTITAAQLAAGSVTASEIAANAVTADKVQANAITASKIAVAATGQNMILDPYPSDQQYWISGAASFVTDSVPEVAAMGFPNAVEFDLTTTASYPNIAKTIKVTAGKTYRATMLARATSNANRRVFMQFNFLDKDGAVVQFGSGGHTYASDLQNPNGTLCVNDKVAPNNAVSATIGYYLLNTASEETAYGPGQGKIWITDIFCGEKVGGELVVDGAITTDKLAANSVNASKIAANTITAAQVAANTLTAAQIAANAITASEIAAGAVTTDKIFANAITAAKIATGTITANEIAGATITGAKIAAGTITAGNIAANTLTASQIAANAITASEIATNAVTAVKIQAGAVSTDKIAANAITAAKIAAATITAAQIASATITGAKIAAGTITASNIAANTITASQIAAGAVATSELAAGAITTDKLAAAAVTAAKIAANTITASQIASGTITASEIASNAVTAAKIQAGAITTNKLAVVGKGAALNSDPNIQDSTAWVKFSGANAVFTTVTDGEIGNNVIRSGAAPWSWYNGAERLALDPSKTYRMTAIARKNATANGTLYVGVAAFDANGANISGDGTQWSYGAATNNAGSTNWTRYSMEFGAGTSRPLPANGVTFAPLVILNYQSTTGYFEAQDIRIEEKIPAELIVDGAITTDKLSANAVTAAKIAANTITAAQIASGTITASQIASNTITASQLAANSVTASEIAANAVTTAKIAAGAITADKIAANSITAGQLAAGSVSTSELAAGAITADKIASNSITAAQLAAGSVSTSELAAGAVTADKIAANSITAGQIAAGAIATSELSTGAVIAEKIQFGTITGDRIAASTIQGDRIAANTITGGLIAASGIITSAAQINNAVVTNAKIANLAVDTVKIANQAVTFPESSFAQSALTKNAGVTSEQTIRSLSVSSTGAPTEVFASFTIDSTYNITGTHTVRIKRGATTLASCVISVSSADQYPFAAAITDPDTSSGSRVYSITIQGFGSWSITNRYIRSLELKK